MKHRRVANATQVRDGVFVGWVEQGETHPIATAYVGFAALNPRYELPCPRMKSKSQPSSACKIVSLNKCA